MRVTGASTTHTCCRQGWPQALTRPLETPSHRQVVPCTEVDTEVQRAEDTSWGSAEEMGSWGSPLLPSCHCALTSTMPAPYFLHWLEPEAIKGVFFLGGGEEMSACCRLWED